MQEFIFDRTGFPMIFIPEKLFWIHLFPVTKYQFKCYIDDPQNANNTEIKKYFSDIFECPETESMQSLTKREKVFQTRILPDELLKFAEWMGPDFTVSSPEEWRVAYQFLLAETVLSDELKILKEKSSEKAVLLIDNLCKELNPISYLTLSLLKNGLLEWIIHEKKWTGIGSPRNEFLPNLWDPLMITVNPISLKERNSFYGFRLIKK